MNDKLKASIAKIKAITSNEILVETTVETTTAAVAVEAPVVEAAEEEAETN